MKVEKKTINENLETWKKSKKDLSENTKLVHTKEKLVLKENRPNKGGLSENTLNKDFKDLWQLKENTYTFKCKGRKELRRLVSECKEKNIRYKFEKTLDETYKYSFTCRVNPLKESQSQEIRASYEELARMNNMSFNEFDKLMADFIRERNHENDMEPLYSERLWTEFKNWAKDTRNLAIKDFGDKEDTFEKQLGENKQEKVNKPQVKESLLQEKYITFPEEYQTSFENQMNELGWVLDNETSRYGAKKFYQSWRDDEAKDLHYQFITKNKVSDEEFDTIMDNTFAFFDDLEDLYGNYVTFSAGLINDGSEYDHRGTMGLDVRAMEVNDEGKDTPVKEKGGKSLYLKNKKPARQQDKDLIDDIAKTMDIDQEKVVKMIGESKVTDKLKLRRQKKFESKVEEPVQKETPVEPKEEVKVEEPKKEVQEESLKEDLQLIGKLEDFTPSEKAKPLWDLIVSKDLVGDLNKLLGELYPSGTAIQDFDDLLVYSPDFIKQMLDINDEDVMDEPLEDAIVGEPTEEEKEVKVEEVTNNDDDDISMIDRLDIDKGVAPSVPVEEEENKKTLDKYQYLSNETGYDDYSEDDDDMSALDAVLALKDDEEEE